MANYDPCEHFYKYSRIEGRPRETELNDATAAKIHDPLWMLSRQYQFGEFQGEDAGSAIFAKVAMNKARLCGYRSDANLQAMDLSLPIETVVERLTPDFDHKMSLRMGRKFQALLQEFGSPLLAWPEDHYRSYLLAKFPFEMPEPDISQSPGILASNAREITLSEASLFLKTISGKAVNGAKLWEFLFNKAGTTSKWVHTPSNPDGFIDPAHKQAVDQAASQWLEWVHETWNIPRANQTQAWRQEKMEYDFDVSIDESQNKTTVLSAEGYHHGHLDWFAFDVAESRRNLKQGEPSTTEGVTREVKTVIATQASFQGMPNARWWELEDCRVDPGNFKATDTDIVALLISQFALHYSNDWLMIPYDIPEGCIVEVEGIVVTDTFGNKTFVEAAHKDSGGSWKDWTMYSLSGKVTGFNATGIEQRIFVPPSTVKVLESEPIEEIRFIRDEMANMVWGIERIVPDRMGSGTDGYQCATAMDQVYGSLEMKHAPPVDDAQNAANTGSTELHHAEATGPQIKFTLGNTVIENWIPFIPVHMKGSNRTMMLQRASMPRISEIKSPHQVRPRTPLLREGIRADDRQTKPYYLNEEEVPRAGVMVTGSFQRSRWYNGKIVLWYGRRKTTGRGEGSSGLRFDQITPKN